MRRICRTMPLSISLTSVEATSKKLDDFREDTLSQITSIDCSSASKSSNPLSSCESFESHVHQLRPAGQVINFGTLTKDGFPSKGVLVPKMRLLFEKAKSLEPDTRYEKKADNNYSLKLLFIYFLFVLDFHINIKKKLSLRFKIQSLKRILPTCK